MILVLDRAGGQISGGGTIARSDPSGSVLRAWCLSAMADGWGLDGMPLEVWDCGADARTTPLLCLTVANAAALVQPSVDQAKAAVRRAEGKMRGRKAKLA